jgi:hypothetical protein
VIWQALSPIVVVLLPILGAVAQRIRRPEGSYRLIKRDLELLASLPEDSAARSSLLRHVDRSIEGLISYDEDMRRSGFGIVLALIFLTSGSALTILAIDGGGWWWWPVIAFLVIFGLVGLAQDAPRRRRDEQGHPIKEAADSDSPS